MITTARPHDTPPPSPYKNLECRVSIGNWNVDSSTTGSGGGGGQHLSSRSALYYFAEGVFLSSGTVDLYEDLCRLKTLMMIKIHLKYMQ